MARYRRIFFALLLITAFACTRPALSEEGETSLEFSRPVKFTAQDRVLVIAPHPDDETIGVGGTIQQAVASGAKVRVCLVTNGENNEFAFIVYEKRVVLKPREFVRLGDMRRQEAIAGLGMLGVPPGDVISLGYPDYGTMEVFLKYWGDTKPFRSMLSRVRKVPYTDALSPEAPYIGDNILKDLKRVIADFRPTKIFVSHPADVNRDHRAAYLFTRVALWDLAVEPGFEQPQVLPYIIHVPGWPMPRGYHPELPMDMPPGLDKGQLAWNVQQLDIAEIARKHDAIGLYPSQIKYAPKYLLTFARHNELFGDFAPLRLARQMASDTELVWEQVGVKDPPKGHIKGDATDDFAEVAYARQGNYVAIKVVLKRQMDRDKGITVSLAGYRPGADFAQMPKIAITASNEGVRVKDGKKAVRSKEILAIQKDKEWQFKVPVSLLGDPDRVLSCVKTVVYGLTLDETAWRVLELVE